MRDYCIAKADRNLSTNPAGPAFLLRAISNLDHAAASTPSPSSDIPRV
jgi:hypothetical protein